MKEIIEEIRNMIDGIQCQEYINQEDSKTLVQAMLMLNKLELQSILESELKSFESKLIRGINELEIATGMKVTDIQIIRNINDRITHVIPSFQRYDLMITDIKILNKHD